MSDFRKKKFDILVSTNLMSRGIDVVHVKTVVNFDAPSTITDY